MEIVFDLFRLPEFEKKQLPLFPVQFHLIDTTEFLLQLLLLLLLLLLQQLLSILLILQRSIFFCHRPGQSPPHVTGHCGLSFFFIAVRAQTRQNAETNCCYCGLMPRIDDLGALHCASDTSVRNVSDCLSFVWRRRDVPSQLVLVFCN